MEQIENILIGFGDAAWGMPLLILLVGGGLFFSIYIGFRPFLYIGHAINIFAWKI